LYSTRNFKGGFKKGIIPALINGFAISWSKGKEFWNFRIKKSDNEAIIKASEAKKIVYPKHDGKITFDILDSVSRSDTYHEHD